MPEVSTPGFGASTAPVAGFAADVFASMLAGKIVQTTEAAADADQHVAAASLPGESLLDALLSGKLDDQSMTHAQPAPPVVETALSCRYPCDGRLAQERSSATILAIPAGPSIAGTSDATLLDGLPASQAGVPVSAGADAKPGASPRQGLDDRKDPESPAPPDAAIAPIVVQMGIGKVETSAPRDAMPLDSAPTTATGSVHSMQAKATAYSTARAHDGPFTAEGPRFAGSSPTAAELKSNFAAADSAVPALGHGPAGTLAVDLETRATSPTGERPLPPPDLPTNYALQTAPHAPVAPSADAAPTQRTLAIPVGTQAWREEFASGVHLLATQRVSSAELRVQPEELGPVRVSIRIEAGEASIACTAQHSETRYAMEAALPRLRELLEASGISVGNASVGNQHPGNGAGQPSAQNQAHAAERSSYFPESPAVTHARPARISDKLVDVYA